MDFNPNPPLPLTIPLTIQHLKSLPTSISNIIFGYLYHGMSYCMKAELESEWALYFSMTNHRNHYYDGHYGLGLDDSGSSASASVCASVWADDEDEPKPVLTCPNRKQDFDSEHLSLQIDENKISREYLKYIYMKMEKCMCCSRHHYIPKKNGVGIYECIVTDYYRFPRRMNLGWWCDIEDRESICSDDPECECKCSCRENRQEILTALSGGPLYRRARDIEWFDNTYNDSIIYKDNVYNEVTREWKFEHHYYL